MWQTGFGDLSPTQHPGHGLEEPGTAGTTLLPGFTITWPLVKGNGPSCSPLVCTAGPHRIFTFKLSSCCSGEIGLTPPCPSRHPNQGRAQPNCGDGQGACDLTHSITHSVKVVTTVPANSTRFREAICPPSDSVPHQTLSPIIILLLLLGLLGQCLKALEVKRQP